MDRKHARCRAGRTAAATRASCGAFSIVEILIALSVVAVMGLVVGRLFGLASELSGRGAALAELDRMASAVEAQLRQDFELLSKTPEDETFIAVRMRRIGDVDNSGALNGNENAFYLSRDDKEADTRDATDLTLTAYADGSRAVTRRFDEIMFLVRGRFTSAQTIGINDPQRDIAAATANAARIYYGHGILPAPFDQGNPGRRTPDGIAPDGVWSNAYGLQGFRNEFAADIPLARHVLLLYGGAAAGVSSASWPPTGAYTASPDRGFVPTPIGVSREYTPYIRDLEAELVDDVFGNLADDTQIDAPSGTNSDARARLVRHGRVDICAQTIEGVRRYLESDNGGTPFTDGRFTVGSNQANEPLHPPGGTLQAVQRLQRVRSAIAGCFARVLVEPVPADMTVQRVPRTGMAPGEPQQEDLRMDAGAILASRCSSFEIAWSDGTTVLADTLNVGPDFNGDGLGDIQYVRDDLVWFDISPAINNNQFLTRHWWFSNHRRDISIRDTRHPLSGGDATDPEIHAGAYASASMKLHPTQEGTAGRGIGTLHGDGALSASSDRGAYSPRRTGGAVDGNRIGDELLCIWPFRRTTDTGYGAAWPKDVLFRIRVTLHDSENRFPEGKRYEFVFRAQPGRFASTN